MKKVLDLGFLELVDMMGDDHRVLDAARVSTGASSKGLEKDELLIDYLMENEHITPFEKIVFEFHVKCPIFVARQWFRHRIGSFNEASARYKEFEFETYVPDVFRKQSKINTQGSNDKRFTIEEETDIKEQLERFYQESRNVYENLLAYGVARELARLVLPMGQYTEFYWTVNFRSLMNFIKLRTDSHAQWEIQQYANTIFQLIEEINKIPLSLNAFKKFILLKE